MRYWQIERLMMGHYLTTDFRISGQTPEEAKEHAESIAKAAGWDGVRLGREVRKDDHYCDFVWVNVT